jgi:K+ transporter
MSAQSRPTHLPEPPEEVSGRRLAKLSVAALGVVFGDIGTSPLYAIRECFHGEYGIGATPDNVFGVLSLIFWSLVLIVTVKYLTFIFRADNHGEGGVIALTALVLGAVFLVGNPESIPVALKHNLAHNKVVHSEVALIHFVTANIPRVPNTAKVEWEKLGGGFHRVTTRYGFTEEPDVVGVLSLAREQGLEFKKEEVSFFVGRQELVAGEHSAIGRIRTRLFRFMARNALGVISFFNVPPEQVIEIGIQLEV